MLRESRCLRNLGIVEVVHRMWNLRIYADDSFDSPFHSFDLRITGRTQELPTLDHCSNLLK